MNTSKSVDLYRIPLKKGDNLDYNNYRSISLTSNIGKIIKLKNLKLKRLYSF